MKVELNDGPCRTAGWVVMVRVAKRQLFHLTSTTSNKGFKLSQGPSRQLGDVGTAWSAGKNGRAAAAAHSQG